MKTFNKWGFYLFTGSILLILITFLSLWSLIEWKSYQGEKELARVLQELSDKGERLTLKELGLDQPTITSPGYYKIETLYKKIKELQKNTPFSHTPAAGYTYLSPNKVQIHSKMESPPFLRWRARNKKEKPSWQDFQTQIDLYTSYLDQVTKIIKSEPIRYGLNYNYGPNIKTPHVSLAVELSKFYSQRSLLYLKNQKHNLVLNDIESLFLLSSFCQNNPLIISKIFQIPIIHITHSVTWELLQQKKLTPKQLQQISTLWKNKGVYSTPPNEFEIERAMGFQFWNELEKNPAQATDKISPFLPFLPLPSYFPKEHIKKTITSFYFKRFYSYDKAFYLQSFQLIIEAKRLQNNQVPHQKIKPILLPLQKKLESLKFNNELIPKYLLSEMAIPFSGDYYFPKLIQTETIIRQTQIAIALKQFQLQHNSLPQNLSELIPHFLPSIPLDPFDGKPMRYQRKPKDSFLLYSVGEDFIDDGGDPSPKTPTRIYHYKDGKDIVWPQP